MLNIKTHLLLPSLSLNFNIRHYSSSKNEDDVILAYFSTRADYYLSKKADMADFNIISKELMVDLKNLLLFAKKLIATKEHLMLFKRLEDEIEDLNFGFNGLRSEDHHDSFELKNLWLIEAKSLFLGSIEGLNKY